MLSSWFASPEALRRGGCTAVASALCLTAARLPAQSTTSPMPDSVRQYVRDAMTAFEAHSVHRAEVNWRALEDSVVARSVGAQTPSDTWLALIWALRRVDPHSFLMPSPAKMMAVSGGMTAPAPKAARAATAFATGGLVDGGIGLVTVATHSGTNRAAYVDSLQARIGALDSAGACGWVVDLRENTGGNMWPMLAGVGPLLGAEVVGSFTNDKPGDGWHYRDGRSWDGGSIPVNVSGWGSATPRLVRDPLAPVALLVGRKTASSGEITLLAFLGRPNVRTFGHSTAGYTSANVGVPLRDGATLFVTSSYPRDRLGRTYPLRIAPDELVPAVESADEDAPLARAIAWLRHEPACARRQ